MELWNIPDKVTAILKYFTGEFEPYISNPRDSRRMFMDEFTNYEQNLVINFIKVNQA